MPLVSARHLSSHADDVIQRIAVTIEIKHRSKTAQATGSRGCLLTATQRTAQNIAEHAAKAATRGLSAAAKHAAQQTAKTATFAAARLLCHIACHQHREDGQHFFQHARIDAGLFSGMASDSAADVFRSKNLAKDIIALFNRCGLWRDNAVKQSAAAKLPQQAAKAV